MTQRFISPDASRDHGISESRAMSSGALTPGDILKLDPYKDAIPCMNADDFGYNEDEGEGAAIGDRLQEKWSLYHKILNFQNSAEEQVRFLLASGATLISPERGSPQEAVITLFSASLIETVGELIVHASPRDNDRYDQGIFPRVRGMYTVPFDVLPSPDHYESFVQQISLDNLSAQEMRDIACARLRAHYLLTAAMALWPTRKHDIERSFLTDSKLGSLDEELSKSSRKEEWRDLFLQISDEAAIPPTWIPASLQENKPVHDDK